MCAVLLVVWFKHLLWFDLASLVQDAPLDPRLSEGVLKVVQFSGKALLKLRFPALLQGTHTR